MTPFDLLLIVAAFCWLLAFGGWLADRIGPDPFAEDRERRGDQPWT